MKTCSKCKREYEATTDNFGPDKRKSDGFQPQCRACRLSAGAAYVKTARGKASLKVHRARYDATCKGKASQKARQKRYHETIGGCLRRLYDNTNQRCSKQQSYSSKGIKCMFASHHELADYVVNIMQVDPRGLDCHRVDNDGHYEPGNIEFITKVEHMKIHGGQLCQKV